MRGVWTALVSPFNSSHELDLSAFKKILNDQREAKVTGVIPCGTTGESPTLSLAEKKTLIQTTLQELKGSGVKVVAGTGSNNTSETIEFSRWASDQGVDGVLLVTPYYNRPSQAGLEAHFLAVADQIKCEVVLYNVPGRTGVSLAAETVARLAAHPKIRTLKEASGNMALTSDILDHLSIAGKSMDILSGDDATYLPLLSVGAVGVISVVSNLFPRAVVAMQAAADRGQFAEARKIHQQYFPLLRDLFIDCNPVPVKWAMAHVGLCDARTRLPLAPLSAAHQKKVTESLARCGVKNGSRL